MVDTIHKQLKTISVIVGENLKIELEKAKEPSHSTYNKQIFLYKQCINFDKWISSLDPLDYWNIDTNFHIQVKDSILRKLNPKRMTLTKSLDKIQSATSIRDISSNIKSNSTLRLQNHTEASNKLSTVNAALFSHLNNYNSGDNSFDGRMTMRKYEKYHK